MRVVFAMMQEVIDKVENMEPLSACEVRRGRFILSAGEMFGDCD
jgi:hypothetical protein